MIRRQSNMLVVNTLEGPKFWKNWETERIASSKHLEKSRGKKNFEYEVDFSRFTPDRYLLSWCTAVAGVEPEEDGHTIVGPHNKWINDNGNAWLNELLLESYHSFIMAENYLEHVQIPAMSKGKILDAVSWVVEKDFAGYKEPIPTIFIDVLVATDKKKHPKLVSDIKSRKINTMSMGCDITHAQCSRCGKVCEEGVDDPCDHIKNQLGRYYKWTDGKRRRTAELCGQPGRKGSCTFKEHSWVRKPAFYWAKLHGFIPESNVSTGFPLKAYVPKSRKKVMAEE